MKQFFKYVLATVVGIVISSILLILVFVGIIGVMISSVGNENALAVKENSILTLNLAHPIPERTSKNPLKNFNFSNFKEVDLGLNDILDRIETAKTDDKIKGIYLDLSSIPSSFATLEEIRNALLDFKTSKKFIIAYSEYYSQSAYYLASTADKIYLNPEGLLEFKGFASQSMFFKGTLDKLGIEAQVIKVGTYKSAVEPFILNKMSDANREQVTSFLGSIYQHYLQEISESRNLPVDSLYAIANELKVRNAEMAVKEKLIDATKYKDEVIEELKSKLKVKEEKDLNFVSLEKYNNPDDKKSNQSKDRVAIVYAVGEIVSGEGSEEQIGSDKISRAIRKARTDKNVKAVVLRVNSPGGSALASDVIWREVKLTKAVKPIVVSMGDVAASGGYYISCAADSIFAQPNTITGSIGVFGIIPNLQGFFNNKLGITFDVVKTGKFSDIQTVSRPLTSEEQGIIQQEVNRIYYTFTQKVAEGRKRERNYIDSIGQGRVWTGEQAIGLGLVDKLGSIDDAIRAAASKAKLKEYKIVTYPALKDPVKALLSEATDNISTWYTKQELGEAYPYYQQGKQILEQTGIQARIPYTINIQ